MVILGIFDTIQNLAASAKEALYAVIIVIAIGFVVVRAVASKLSIASVVVAALAAGLLIWVVSNVELVSDNIGEELSMSSVTAHATGHPAASELSPIRG